MQPIKRKCSLSGWVYCDLNKKIISIFSHPQMPWELLQSVTHMTPARRTMIHRINPDLLPTILHIEVMLPNRMTSPKEKTMHWMTLPLILTETLTSMVTLTHPGMRKHVPFSILSRLCKESFKRNQ